MNLIKNQPNNYLSDDSDITGQCYGVFVYNTNTDEVMNKLYFSDGNIAIKYARSLDVDKSDGYIEVYSRNSMYEYLDNLYSNLDDEISEYEESRSDNPFTKY